MINQQILDYIKQQLQQGVSREQIKSSLMTNGWQTQDIEESFAAVNFPVSPEQNPAILAKSPMAMWKIITASLIGVAVIGGGNSALEAVLDMVNIAKHIYLVSLTQLTSDPILIDKVQAASNVTIFLEHRTERIEGKDFVEAIVIKDQRSGQTKRLEVGGIFVEIGLVPNSEPVKGLAELNKWGEVIVNVSCETTVPGLYVAGDVTNVPEKQIVVAAGEGAKAVLQAHRYLQWLAA